MRDYGKLSPQFWIGRTGRQLRGDADAQLVAAYLVTAPGSTMLGVYYCPVATVANDIGLTMEGASKALRRVCEAGFCTFDAETEWVWVHEMARFQIEASLAPKDKRVVGIARDFEKLPESPLKQGFHARYHRAFSLPNWSPEGGFAASPFEGASEPHRCQEQEQEQKKDPNQGAGLSGKGSVGARAARDGLKVVAGGAAFGSGGGPMKFALHPHQSAALDMLRASLLAGHRRPMVQAPTGFGKTLVAAATVEGALAKGKRVLFVVLFLSLVDQTVAALAEQGIASVGVMQGFHPLTDGSQPVQVASVQTLQRRRVPPADIVIIDEAHRMFAFVGEWMAHPDWQRVPFVGLSATPWAKGLGRHFDDLIVAATTAELIEKGFLAPFRVFAPAHPDLSKVRTARGDYHEGDLAEVMSEPVLIADTVATWLRLGENRPTLLFAVDRAHARRLAAEFEAAGVATGYVDADTPRDERELIGGRLRNGQIRVVCNVGCLTTGIDWDVRCIVLARPTKSEMLFVQIVGRGLRTADDKTDCLILDHSDTTLRLGFVSDIHHATLDDGKHRPSQAKAREKAAPLPKECPSCSFLKPAGIRACPSCGFVPERQSMIEEKAGSLVQLNGRRKGKGEATPHTKQQTYSMLVWWAKEKGFKPSYAAAKYRDRYGVCPRGLAADPMPPDAPFLNWMKSQQIAWAKAKRAANTAEATHAAA